MTTAKLISITVEDRPGTVAAVLAALAGAGINILSVFGWAPQGVLELVVDDPAAATAALAKIGVASSEGEAEIVEMANKPGTLHAFLEGLARQGVNLRSLSGFSGAGGQSWLVWTRDA